MINVKCNVKSSLLHSMSNFCFGSIKQKIITFNKTSNYCKFIELYRRLIESWSLNAMSKFHFATKSSQLQSQSICNNKSFVFWNVLRFWNVICLKYVIEINFWFQSWRSSLQAYSTCEIFPSLGAYFCITPMEKLTILRQFCV